ncbi:DUF167 domain-containing protein [Actinopolymorpha sp. B17G11]|uniref:DUF167 domain-containing protein n=1 Tax=unclassified Actinopolymorpha TaxID=2627063 RepID=UPI0032D9AC1B
MESSKRIAVRVKPGARRTSVGGTYTGRNGPSLVVSVTAPAVDGRASDAAGAALAAAFGVPARRVSLVSGQRSRDKIFEVAAPDVEERLVRLLSGRDSGDLADRRPTRSELGGR